jgi:hypothetical protein
MEHESDVQEDLCSTELKWNYSIPNKNLFAFLKHGSWYLDQDCGTYVCMYVYLYVCGYIYIYVGYWGVGVSFYLFWLCK